MAGAVYLGTGGLSAERRGDSLYCGCGRDGGDRRAHPDHSVGGSGGVCRRGPPDFLSAVSEENPGPGGLTAGERPAPGGKSAICGTVSCRGFYELGKVPFKENTMTTVYFVRHAEPNYDNHDDLLRELSPKGLQDRKRVTEFLAEKQIDIVLSSPYRRAVDTIQDFADRYGFEVQIVDDFRERKVDDTWIEDFTAFSKKQWEDFCLLRRLVGAQRR